MLLVQKVVVKVQELFDKYVTKHRHSINSEISGTQNIHIVENLILNNILMSTSLFWCHLFIEQCLSVYYFLHQFTIITHKW